jgi:hypothetical protein
VRTERSLTWILRRHHRANAALLNYPDPGGKLPQEKPVPWWTSLVLATISTVLSFGAAEGLVRLADGGVLGRLACFEQSGDRIGMAPGAWQSVSSPSGAVEFSFDDRGFRQPSPDFNLRPWLVVGDSQVLGWGVSGDAAFPAVATALGVPMVNAGVPGHGVADALDLAAAHRHAVGGVVVVVNQANDWAEAGAAVGSRYEVAGGWLLDRSRAGTVNRAFFASPLSRSHLLHYAFVALSAGLGSPEVGDPSGLLPPSESATAAIGSSIRQFRSHHEVPLVVLFLPVDAAASEERASTGVFSAWLDSSGAEPWRSTAHRDALRRAVGEQRVIDALEVLQKRPDAFLEGDYHLSEIGHELVAARLVLAVRDEMDSSASSP